MIYLNKIENFKTIPTRRGEYLLTKYFLILLSDDGHMLMC